MKSHKKIMFEGRTYVLESNETLIKLGLSPMGGNSWSESEDYFQTINKAKLVISIPESGKLASVLVKIIVDAGDVGEDIVYSKYVDFEDNMSGKVISLVNIATGIDKLYSAFITL